MPITRTTSGLIFRDTFDRANGAPGANWSLGAGSWSILSNEMTLQNGGGANAQAEVNHAVMSPREEMVVQGVLRRSADNVYQSLCARMDRAAGIFYFVRLHPDTDVILIVRNQGGAVLSSQSFPTAPGTNYPIKFHVADSLQKVWSGGVLRGSSTDAVHDGVSGTAGFQVSAFSTSDAFYNDFAVYATNVIVCSDLPTGWKLRAGGVTAVESGGVATLDLGGVVCPVAAVEVLDDSDVVQETISDSNVWGGDVYTYSAPLPPVASFTSSIDGRTVSVDASASSDPDGTIESYDWDWGDGTAHGSGVTAEHEYEFGGEHTITLTVTDEADQTDGATEDLVIGGLAECAAAGATAWEECAADDPQGYTDFSEYDTGAQPVDWTHRWDEGGAWEIVDGTAIGAIGGHVLRSTGGLITLPDFLSWDEVDDVGTTPRTIWARVRTEEVDVYISPSIVIRGSGAAGSRNGISAGLIDAHATDQNPIGFERVLNDISVLDAPDGGAVRYAVDTWYWLRLDVAEVSGTDLPLTLRLYEDDDGEPGDVLWTDTRTETADLLAETGGWIGIGRNGQQGMTLYVDVFKVGEFGSDHTPTADSAWEECDAAGTTAWAG